MKYRWSSALRAGGSAVVAVGLLASICLLAPDQTVERWREAAIDRLLPLAAPPVSGRVVVVDIDGESIDAIGPWPWPRERLTALIGRIASGVPRTLGIDIVLAGEDRYGPQQLRHILPAADAELMARFEALADTDAALATTISSAPTVLAALFSGRPETELASMPVLTSGPLPQLAPWSSAGAVGPLPKIGEKAAGVGIASLAGDHVGTIRKVPLMGTADGAIVGGFAAEVLRQSEAAGAYILDGTEGVLRIGDHAVPLVREVDMRFRPSDPAGWSSRTVAASAVLSDSVPSDRFEGRIVLLGGSAPQLGALRATAMTPLAPSVQIQADAIETALSGRIPYRPGWAHGAEAAAFILLAAIGILAGAFLGSATAGGVTIVAVLAWLGAVTTALVAGDIVLDPVTPALAALVSVIAAGTVSAVLQRRLAANIRRRFEQHLAPSVVARIVERPDLVRFEGERREITALFTDIEGFTALTDRMDPKELIALLDEYLDGVVAVIVEHGGMVDKVVGDAVHAFFNAPVDLDDHPRKALAAAHGIIVLTERFMKSETGATAGIGRTRIGIETGDVVIGDVGKGLKVDYTAHGNAVNTAARLEALNKTFGTSICVGPQLRKRLADEAFRPLGQIDVRGRGMLDVFTPIG